MSNAAAADFDPTAAELAADLEFWRNNRPADDMTDEEADKACAAWEANHEP